MRNRIAIIVRVSLCNLGLLVLLSIAGCCGDDKGTTMVFHFEQGERSINNYQKGQEFTLIHSGGSEVKFIVQSRDIIQDEMSGATCDECLCGGRNFWRFDRDETHIQSDDPKIDLTFTIYSGGFDSTNAAFIDVLNSRFIFPAPIGHCPTDTTYTTCVDSVTIEGKIYHHVFKMKRYDQVYSNFNNLLRATELLFTIQNGVLQIEMSNNEVYSLKP